MDHASGTPVAIVGGGPVGMVLALFLDRYGVPAVIFNEAPDVAAVLRGNTHNARTMEHYRTLGLAPAIRRLGLPWDHAAGIAFFTRYGTHELCHVDRPGPGAALRRVAAAARTDQVPEPMHRANQVYVERLLLAHLRTRPRITVKFGTRVTAIAERPGRVELTTESAAGEEHWTAGYTAGCDGGRSTVRRALGVRYEGESGLDQDVLGRTATAAHLRIPALYGEVLGPRRAWSYWSFNAELALNLIAVDGAAEFFLLSSSIDPATATAADYARLVGRAVGRDVAVEVLSHRPWAPGAALVAERFAGRRTALAGDAAHLFTPNGGFGMNTGVDDVSNLAWKLAAAVRGWAGPGLLPSYERERRPVALRNTAAARELNVALGAIERPALLEQDSPAGKEARARIGAQLAAYAVRTIDTLGVALGVRYDGSPLIDAGPDVPPPDDFGRYIPSAVPGGRAPHLWLDDVHNPGGSLFDRFGAGFTVLQLGERDRDAEELRAALAAVGAPVSVLRVTDPAARELYGRDLAIVRPDQYLAWRGDRAPSDPGPLAGHLTGH